MGMDPARISPILELANGNLGPLNDRLIHQRGEAWAPSPVSPFKILKQAAP